MKYALAAGILGGFAGSVLGMALAGGMTKMYLAFFNIPLLKINFYVSYVLMAILLSALICAVSGVVGAVVAGVVGAVVVAGGLPVARNSTST